MPYWVSWREYTAKEACAVAHVSTALDALDVDFLFDYVPATDRNTHATRPVHWAANLKVSFLPRQQRHIVVAVVDRQHSSAFAVQHGDLGVESRSRAAIRECDVDERAGIVETSPSAHRDRLRVQFIQALLARRIAPLPVH